MFIRLVTSVTVLFVILTGCTGPSHRATSLRSGYIKADKAEIAAVIKSKNFYDKRHNRYGGFKTTFSREVRDGKQVVVSTTFRLMWAAEGSLNMMTFKEAGKWIGSLNRKRFAGYNNWRLPTVEEAAVMLRKELNKDNLFTYDEFSPVQRFIWTGDSYSENIRWAVSFSFGSVTTDSINGSEFVRPVRSIN